MRATTFDRMLALRKGSYALVNTMLPIHYDTNVYFL